MATQSLYRISVPGLGWIKTGLTDDPNQFKQLLDTGKLMKIGNQVLWTGNTGERVNLAFPGGGSPFGQPRGGDVAGTVDADQAEGVGGQATTPSPTSAGMSWLDTAGQRNNYTPAPRNTAGIKGRVAPGMGHPVDVTWTPAVDAQRARDRATAAAQEKGLADMAAAPPDPETMNLSGDAGVEGRLTGRVQVPGLGQVNTMLTTDPNVILQWIASGEAQVEGDRIRFVKGERQGQLAGVIERPAEEHVTDGSTRSDKAEGPGIDSSGPPPGSPFSLVPRGSEIPPAYGAAAGRRNTTPRDPLDQREAAAWAAANDPRLDAYLLRTQPNLTPAEIAAWKARVIGEVQRQNQQTAAQPSPESRARAGTQGSEGMAWTKTTPADVVSPGGPASSPIPEDAWLYSGTGTVDDWLTALLTKLDPTHPLPSRRISELVQSVPPEDQTRVFTAIRQKLTPTAATPPGEQEPRGSEIPPRGTTVTLVPPGPVGERPAPSGEPPAPLRTGPPPAPTPEGPAAATPVGERQAPTPPPSSVIPRVGTGNPGAPGAAPAGPSDQETADRTWLEGILAAPKPTGGTAPVAPSAGTMPTPGATPTIRDLGTMSQDQLFQTTPASFIPQGFQFGEGAVPQIKDQRAFAGLVQALQAAAATRGETLTTQQATDILLQRGSQQTLQVPTLAAVAGAQNANISNRVQTEAETQGAFTRGQTTGKALGTQTIDLTPGNLGFVAADFADMQNGQTNNPQAFQQRRLGIIDALAQLYNTWDPPDRIVDRLAKGETILGLTLPTIEGGNQQLAIAELTGEYEGRRTAQLIVAAMPYDQQTKVAQGWDFYDDLNGDGQPDTGVVAAKHHVYGTQEWQSMSQREALALTQQGFDWVDPETLTNVHVLGTEQLAMQEFTRTQMAANGYWMTERNEDGTAVLDQYGKPIVKRVMGTLGLDKYRTDLEGSLQKRNMSLADSRYYAGLAVQERQFEGYEAIKRDDQGNPLDTNNDGEPDTYWVYGSGTLPVYELGQRMLQQRNEIQAQRNLVLLNDQLARVARSEGTLTMIDPITHREVMVLGQVDYQRRLAEIGTDQTLRAGFGGYVAVTNPDTGRTVYHYAEGSVTHDTRMTRMAASLTREGWTEAEAGREKDRAQRTLELFGGFVTNADGESEWHYGTMFSQEQMADLARTHNIDVIELQAKFDERRDILTAMRQKFLNEQVHRNNVSEAVALRAWQKVESELDRQLRLDMQTGDFTHRDAVDARTRGNALTDTFITGVSGLAAALGNRVLDAWTAGDIDPSAIPQTIGEWKRIPGLSGLSDNDAKKLVDGISLPTLDVVDMVGDGAGGGSNVVGVPKEINAIKKLATTRFGTYGAGFGAALDVVGLGGISASGATYALGVVSGLTAVGAAAYGIYRGLRAVAGALSAKKDHITEGEASAYTQFTTTFNVEAEERVPGILEKYHLGADSQDDILESLAILQSGQIDPAANGAVALLQMAHSTPSGEVKSLNEGEARAVLDIYNYFQAQEDPLRATASDLRTLMDNGTFQKEPADLTLAEEEIVLRAWRQLPGTVRTANATFAEKMTNLATFGTDLNVRATQEAKDEYAVLRQAISTAGNVLLLTRAQRDAIQQLYNQFVAVDDKDISQQILALNQSLLVG